jgi:hypothetical protein
VYLLVQASWGRKRPQRPHTLVRLEFFFINSFFPPQQRYNVIGKV